jgi:hypothetical protein
MPSGNPSRPPKRTFSDEFPEESEEESRMGSPTAAPELRTPSYQAPLHLSLLNAPVQQQNFTVFAQNGPPQQQIPAGTTEPTPPIWAVAPPMVPTRHPVPSIIGSNLVVMRSLWEWWDRTQRRNWYQHRWGLDDVQITHLPAEMFEMEDSWDGDDEEEEEEEGEDDEEEGGDTVNEADSDSSGSSGGGSTAVTASGSSTGESCGE